MKKKGTKIPATQVHHPNGRNYSFTADYQPMLSHNLHITRGHYDTPREATPPD